MSVPKRKQNESKVIYFTYACTLIDTVTKYLLSDFGTTRTYRDLSLFTDRAKMDKRDKSTLYNLSRKYHFNVEASYPNYILDYYRKTILEIMNKLLEHITRAHTMFPNSVYEFNIKRQYQSDAIADCYDLLHNLQNVIRLFNGVNLEAYTPIADMVNKEISHLRNWRKNSNSIKKACYANDAKARRLAETGINKEEFNRQIKAVEYDDVVSKYQYNITNTKIYRDDNGALQSTLPIPCIYYVDENDKFTSFGLD